MMSRKKGRIPFYEPLGQLPTKEQLLVAARGETTNAIPLSDAVFTLPRSEKEPPTTNDEVKKAPEVQAPEYGCEKLWSPDSRRLEGKLRAYLKTDPLALLELSALLGLVDQGDCHGIGVVETLLVEVGQPVHHVPRGRKEVSHSRSNELTRIFSTWKYIRQEHSSSKVNLQCVL
jgi:hypothetical protein